ncbi:cytokine receptor common subunit gamma-like [Lampris incognitus]|uniref:cytokine receptor common subunit gamma-like n=1 Tax=Lampris incognitus TaxID=2546036 RepID=UPI0024B530D2|nr:cytokine receptor common subunit gamma-like [Lampris incognitus]
MWNACSQVCKAPIQINSMSPGSRDLSDVDCIIIDVDYVLCTWAGQGTPEVNYTFLSWFGKNPQPNKCDTYISENGTNTGCKQPYDNLKIKMFQTLHTKLKYGNVRLHSCYTGEECIHETLKYGHSCRYSKLQAAGPKQPAMGVYSEKVCSLVVQHQLLEKTSQSLNILLHGIAAGAFIKLSYATQRGHVKLNPPTNVTSEIGSESNLWFYWNHSFEDCAACQVRYWTNNNNWEMSTLSYRKHNYCINLPSRTSRYELQVRSTVGELCAKSIYWSDWSQPVFWGPVSKNHTLNRPDSLLLSLLGAITPFVLLVMVTTVYRERIKVILLPVFPNPSEKFKFNEFQIHDNVEEWLHISKGLKEGLKPNFNEHICSVREYNLGPDSASECSDSSSSSVATDQTNCSISMESNESDCLSLSCSSSASTLPFSSEEGQNTV